VEFLNECLKLDVSLSRRFTSSTSVTPTTDFSLSLDLVGFGGGAAAGPARTCRP
jgi:LPS-assembly protein